MKQNAKRLSSALLGVCMLTAAIPAANAAQGHWAQKTMDSFAAAGYLSGGDGQYDPDSPMDRVHFAAMLNRIKGFDVKSGAIDQYADVPAATEENGWYRDELAAALAAGYLQGADGMLLPETPLPRYQAFVILSRLLGLSGANADQSVLDRFTDADQIPDWARGEVATMVQAGYVEGSGGALDPNAVINNASAAAMLERALDELKHTVVVNGTAYVFSTDAGALTGGVQIDGAGVSYAVKSGTPQSGTLYGTASLDFDEFYAGDVTSTDGFDAVTTATVSKHAIMGNMYTDWTADKEDGYRILGVANVNVAVDAEQYVKAAVLKAAGKLEGSGQGYEEAAQVALNRDASQAVSQYKTLRADGTYSATEWNVADTVTDATAALKTGSVWGDYEIDVTDPEGISYLRNTREDAGFPINSQLQGVILTARTVSGEERKVGLEYLQSTWVQPYEISFNVDSINTGNVHIAKWDNLAELSQLLGATVTEIAYIMPDSVYVYTFADGIYIKPALDAEITGSLGEGVFHLDGVPEALEDPQLTVTYTVVPEGSVRGKAYTLYSGAVADSVQLDMDVLAQAGEGGTYSAKVSSRNYADITVTIAAQP